MKWEFYFYWTFYIMTFGVECYFETMPVWASYAILTSYWVSYIFLGAVFGSYMYFDKQYYNTFAEGLLGAFISRSLLQIISIFGFDDKKYIIVITGFMMLVWVGIVTNRNLKNRLSKSNITFL